MSDSPPGWTRLFDTLAVFALAALLALEVHVAYALSITYDEYVTIAASVADVTHRRVVMSPGHPPLARILCGAWLTALGVEEGPAAPLYARIGHDYLGEWAYGEQLITGQPTFRFPFAHAGVDSITVAARLPMLVFPLLAAFVTWRWARARWGAAGGLLALVALLGWSDFLGHGAVVKFDVTFAACALASAYAFDELARRGGALRLVLAGLSVGAVFASRLTAPFFAVGLLPAIALALLRPTDPAPATVTHPFGTGTSRARAALLGALVVLLVATIAFVAAYLFHDPIAEWRRALLEFVPSVAEDTRRAYERAGFTGREVLYFPVVLALKTPLPLIALFALAKWRTAADLVRTRAELVTELLLHVPPLAILLATIRFAPPFGSRYAIASVIFLVASVGRLAPWAKGSRWRVALVASLALAGLAGTAREHPNHASAANALAGGTSGAWRHLDNANVDVGGGLKLLASWQRAHRVPHLVVVGFATNPFQVVPDPSGGPPRVGFATCPRVALLGRYGVSGELQNPSVLFAPEPGKVYAVSTHVAAHARAFERELAGSGAAWPFPTRVPVLGGAESPTDVVGGAFLIFDRRDPAR